MIQYFKMMEKMMKKLSMLTLFLSAMTFGLSAYAGSGHSHDKDGGHGNHVHSHGPVSESGVKERATRMLQGLIKRGVIEKSWEGAKPVNAEKKMFSKGEEWVISFKNDKLKDKSRQTLYIFYSLDGHYIAANYTGQ